MNVSHVCAALCALVAYLCQCAIGQDCTRDVLFVLDSSGSVQEEWGNQLQLITDVAGILQIWGQDGPQRAAIVAYSGSNFKVNVKPFSKFNDSESFVKVVNALRYLSGTTYTGRALKYAVELLNTERRANKRVALVVITDGYSTDNIKPQIEALKALSDIDIFAVAASDQHRRSELDYMVTSMDNVFVPPDYQRKATEALVAQLECPPDVTRAASTRSTAPAASTSTPPPPPPPPSTQRSPTTTTTVGQTPGSTPPPLTGPSATTCPLDLLLVVDSSPVCSALYEGLRAAAERFAGGFNVGPTETQIAVIQHGAGSRTVAHMADIASRSSAIAALSPSSLRWQPAVADMSSALALAPAEFDVEQGARWGDNVRKAAVVFTHGYSWCDGELAAKHAQELSDRGVEIYAVHVDNAEQFGVDMAGLVAITKSPDSIFTTSNLDDLVNKLNTAGCEPVGYELPNVRPPNPDGPGYNP